MRAVAHVRRQGFMSLGDCRYSFLASAPIAPNRCHDSVRCHIDPCPESSIPSLVDIGIDDTCGVEVE
jgi:hypothetical protein